MGDAVAQAGRAGLGGGDGCGVGAGGIAWLVGWRAVADWCWIAGTVTAVVPAVVWVLAALRRGRVGVDLIAVLSLVGTLLVGEYLAGALIAVMLAGGRALEAAAARRASHDLRALLERAPRFARRRVGSEVSVIPLAEVVVDDVLVVGPGEVVPVDGRIVDTVAVLDESVLTGEPLQVERDVGEPVRSGVVNAGNAFELRATATAEESTYAGIVRLASGGRGRKRADRAAGRPVRGMVFTADAAGGGRGLVGQRVGGAGGRGAGGGDAVSAAAGGAGGDRVRFVAGLSAGRGDPQRRRVGKPRPRNDSGDGQDRHADDGAPGRRRRRWPHPGRDATEVLRLAASVDQMSPHVLAEAIVTEALTRGLRLSLPADVVEEPGRGVTATVDGHRVAGRQTHRRNGRRGVGPRGGQPGAASTPPRSRG